jgi:transposase-like protein
MGKIHEIASDGAETPRFDDGMANMAELIRVMAESLANETMDAQADEACEAGSQRSGCRERRLAASAGAIDLGIPKLRAGSYFPEGLIGRCSRVDRAVVAAVSGTVTDGASARKAKRVAQSMGIDRMSASQVSRMCPSLDDAAADLQERGLSDVKHPYVRLDAAYIKRRDGGRVQPTAPVTAIGAGSGGHRRLPGLDAIDAESCDGWRAFPLSLRARGVEGVACVTSDAHEGLKRAIQEAFPGAAWQRRIVRLMRDAAGNAPTRQRRGAALGIPKAVFAERGPELVREPYRLATEQIEGFRPKAAEALEEAEADAPACLDLPYGHHARLRADDVQERADRELERRSRVVQVFPGRKPLIRMMGAVFAETDEDWAGRRWFNDDSIGRAVEGAEANAPAHACEGTAAEHAAGIIALVVADNPVPGGKAA